MTPFGYFDLSSHAARAGVAHRGASAAIPPAEQLAIYAGCLLGVLFGAAVRGGGSTAVPAITWAGIGLAAVVALAILPLAFERLSVRPRAPLLFRVGLAVQQGVFWQVLLAAAGRSLGG
jgi:hypothetical protein